MLFIVLGGKVMISQIKKLIVKVILFLSDFIIEIDSDGGG